MAFESGRGAVGKITVPLGREAYRALQEAVAREQISETDLVNRAVSMYGFWASQRAQGSVFLIRLASGEQYRMEML